MQKIQYQKVGFKFSVTFICKERGKTTTKKNMKTNNFLIFRSQGKFLGFDQKVESRHDQKRKKKIERETAREIA